MSLPIIGLTTSRFHKRSVRTVLGVNEPYTRSVIDAGGIPVLVPINLPNDDLEGLLSRIDGLLLTGGYDVDPQRYGNPPHRKVEGIDPDRDRTEIFLVKGAIQRKKPFLGICRGCQVINVALGGSLYEDLGEQFQGNILHDRHDRPRDYLAHSVNVEPGSSLSRILVSSNPQVNSLHHQGVRQLAQGLSIAATAQDGLIEAFELNDHHFGVAVQWHPEELQEHAPMRSLFSEFVKSCQPKSAGEARQKA
jgi:putative glutamine amidotransferase